MPAPAFVWQSCVQTFGKRSKIGHEQPRPDPKCCITIYDATISRGCECECSTNRASFQVLHLKNLLHDQIFMPRFAREKKEPEL